MTQPTALFLADILEDAGKPADIAEKCAAELRRLHDQIIACEPYLKEGETPAERIERDHRDSLALMTLLAREKTKNEAMLEALKLIVEFVDAPTEGKRPDVFVMRISKALAAIAKAEKNI